MAQNREGKLREEIKNKFLSKDFLIEKGEILSYLALLGHKDYRLAQLMAEEWSITHYNFPFTQEVYPDLNKDKLYKNAINYKNDFKEVHNYVLKNQDISFQTGLFDPTLYEGQKILVEHDDVGTFLTINILTDFFTEDLRIDCRRTYKKFTPARSWNRIKEMTKVFLKLIQDQNVNNTITLISIRQTFYRVASECTNFRITLVISILDFFSPSKILVPSEGWGDRLIGTMAWNESTKKVDLYTSVEPNPALHPRFEKIIDYFKADDIFRLFEAGFETIPENALLKYGKFDLVFTSPPYFKLELYQEEDDSMQSVNRFTNPIDWFFQFLVEGICIKSFKVLKVGGNLALSLSDQILGALMGESFIYIEALVLTLGILVPYFDFRGVLGHAKKEMVDNNGVYRDAFPIFVWKKSDKKLDKNTIEKYEQGLKQTYPFIYERIKQELALDL